MNIKVAVISNKVSKFYKEAIYEYEKRLTKYCKIKIFYLKNEEELMKLINKKDYIIKISTYGTLISSERLAEKINSMALTGDSNILFIIGEAENLRADEIIAISRMDMDSGLLGSIIVEQIYRAYRIISNQPYHK